MRCPCDTLHRRRVETSRVCGNSLGKKRIKRRFVCEGEREKEWLRAQADQPARLLVFDRSWLYEDNNLTDFYMKTMTNYRCKRDDREVYRFYSSFIFEYIRYPCPDTRGVLTKVMKRNLWKKASVSHVAKNKGFEMANI